MKRGYCLSAMLIVAGLVGPMLAKEARADEPRQRYTAWEYEPEKKRYTCYYEYKPQPQAKTYEKQVVVYYPQEQQKGWYYYYNPQKQTYWGRCPNKNHTAYQPQQMQWSYLDKEKQTPTWGPITNSCPTIPGTQSGPEIAPPPDPPGIPQANLLVPPPPE